MKKSLNKNNNLQNDTSKKQPCHGCSKNKGKPDIILWFSLVSVGSLYVLGALLKEEIAHYPWLETMAHTSHHMVNSIWWGILVGIIFIGILSKIPREFIMSILGNGGTFGGILRATSAGVLLDVCSHGVLMISTKLYERGASAGQVMAFLLASPWNSFSLTLILIGLIGFYWTISFIILSMIIAIITGMIFDKLVSAGTLPPNHNNIDLPEDFEFWKEAKKRFKETSFNTRFIKDMAINGVKDSRMVVRWVLFGILLAAILRVLFNPEQFEQYFGPSMLGLMVTVAVATILEVCSEGSTPIAADILNRAKAPGNGFAFLMAGVSTDYTEVMILKDTTKSWKIALFLPLITVPQVILVAWLINTFSL